MPRTAHRIAVLEEMLASYCSSRRVEVLKRYRPIAAETTGDRISAVTLLNEENGEQVVITAPYILDATELGDLLELAQVEHVIGAESQAQTDELHAVQGEPQPLDQQAITWCFAMDYLPSGDYTIAKPEDYDFWKGYQADFWPGPQLGWQDVHPQTLETRHRGVFHGPTQGRRVSDFWHYRRILDQSYYISEFMPSDITLVNWPQIDYWLRPLLGVSEEEKAKALHACKQLSFSFLYWMQTEAPRAKTAAPAIAAYACVRT